MNELLMILGGLISVFCILGMFFAVKRKWLVRALCLVGFLGGIAWTYVEYQSVQESRMNKFLNECFLAVNCKALVWNVGTGMLNFKANGAEFNLTVSDWVVSYDGENYTPKDIKCTPLSRQLIALYLVG
ncbi:hypothetical protein HZB94_04555 [Candidatus Falkowbacteria bacterium]|nr:hypothetical protein [Candidatus Falkowbacteria bacterium]